MKTLSILTALMIGITVAINMEEMIGVIYTNNQVDDALILLRPAENRGSVMTREERVEITVEQYLDVIGDGPENPLAIIVPPPQQ